MRAAILLLALTTNASAALYVCENPDGSVTFTHRECDYTQELILRRSKAPQLPSMGPSPYDGKTFRHRGVEPKIYDNQEYLRSVTEAD